MNNKQKLYVLDDELEFMKKAYSNLSGKEAASTFIRDMVAIKKGLLYVDTITTEEAEELMEIINDTERSSIIN